mgnify:CR=1 FL=1
MLEEFIWLLKTGETIDEETHSEEVLWRQCAAANTRKSLEEWRDLKILLCIHDTGGAVNLNSL